MSATPSFGRRLAAAMSARGRLCVGIDPHAALLAQWGLGDDAQGLRTFALRATEAIAPVAGIIKPQSAFFERFGSAGVAVLEEVVRIGREAGALVLVDVKRGDIGSTSQAYADSYLAPSSPLFCDAMTTSPYLGFGSMDPMIDTARTHGGGVFALALTSNPEGPQFQHARTTDGRPVAQVVLESLRALNADEIAQGAPMGSFGAVVGATIGSSARELGLDLAIDGPILAPGFGAQGGTVADLVDVFGDAAGQVLPSSSREILAAGPDAAALREAVLRGNDAVAALG